MAKPDAGGSGGAGGTGGAAGSGGGVPGECANIACLQQVEDLLVGCAGDGTCVDHADVPGIPGTLTKCYENGVKVLETFDTSQNSTSHTLSNTFKVEKDGSLCYTRSSVSVTMDVDAGTGAKFTSDGTMQDASGTTIATIHIDTDGVATVTCPGGQPTVVSASCGFPALVISSPVVVKSTAATVCDNGTCTF
jgi:hypothetical protein